MLTQAKLQTRQDSKWLRWKLFIVWNNTRLCNLNNKLRETSVLTIKGQPVMLRRRQGRKVSRLVFKHHRGRDDFTTHSNLQHHQPCVMSWKQTTGKGLSRGMISGDSLAQVFLLVRLHVWFCFSVPRTDRLLSPWNLIVLCASGCTQVSYLGSSSAAPPAGSGQRGRWCGRRDSCTRCWTPTTDLWSAPSHPPAAHKQRPQFHVTHCGSFVQKTVGHKSVLFWHVLTQLYSCLNTQSVYVCMFLFLLCFTSSINNIALSPLF